MRIGIDFDNTIAGYDHLFDSLARTKGWLPQQFSGTKRTVRDTLRGLDGGEEKWMQLQAAVYGEKMSQARLIDGVGDFLKECMSRSVSVFIVSHKTQYAPRDANRVNLREAALGWMKEQGFFAPDGFAIPRDHVAFEATREEKCRKIGDLGLSHFIDDLEEVFLDSFFPSAVEQHLFHPGPEPVSIGPFRVHTSWTDIKNDILA